MERRRIGYIVYLQLIFLSEAPVSDSALWTPLVDLCLAKALDDLGSVDDASVGSFGTAKDAISLLDVVVAHKVRLGYAVKRSVACKPSLIGMSCSGDRRVDSQLVPEPPGTHLPGP